MSFEYDLVSTVLFLKFKEFNFISESKLWFRLLINEFNYIHTLLENI